MSHDHLRELPMGVPLMNMTKHMQQERNVSKSVNVGEWHHVRVVRCLVGDVM